MGDVLDPLLKQLRSRIDEILTYNPSSEEAVDCKKMIAESFNELMNNLRKMMLGYENEEVYGLLTIMEGVAKTTAWYSSVEAMMDMMLEIIEELCNFRYVSNVEGEEVSAGFDDEVETLLDELTESKQFQVISIVGTAGLGKTTLARKLYTLPFIKAKFHIRAWTTVSQDYVKRNLLLDILRSFNYDLRDEISNMTEGQLGRKLYQSLKGKKYLVVLDDIWDCNAWNIIKIYFPADETGSRIIFTSRDTDVCLHVGGARPAHALRFRTLDERWEIFKKKVFKTGICPHRLKIIGREILNKCEGLPLAIVITAGLLKNKWLDSYWRQIADDLHSSMVRNRSQYIDSLALSYNHLPPYLKPCFLFLGVFPEDFDIPVTKLIWLWVAQGFIHQTENKILEDVAEDFLINLIQRSVLMIAKTRADGQIKSCRIHDLLRDFCLKNAEKEQNSQRSYRYGRASALASSSTITDVLHRLSINHPSASATHSGLCYPFELGKVLQESGKVFSKTFKSLRILDVESIPSSEFPSDVIQLVNLRYLAIQAHDGSPQASISNLINLQMLIILSRKNIVVPKTIWNMVNLRHLYIKSGENLIEEPNELQMTEDGALPNLQTCSQVCPQSCNNIFSKAPKLRKLGFCGSLISSHGDLEFPDIVKLEHLQKLKLLNTCPYPERTRLCNHHMFPKTVEKLTLSNTGLDWEQIWTFACLSNLKVLKLRAGACVGEKWGTSKAKFETLKVLKLHDLDLEEWDCWSDNFPRLRRLVVRRCLKLSGIPLDLGMIGTLELIEVSGCSKSAHESALEIQTEQKDEGNDFLKFQIDQQHKSYDSQV